MNRVARIPALAAGGITGITATSRDAGTTERRIPASILDALGGQMHFALKWGEAAGITTPEQTAKARAAAGTAPAAVKQRACAMRRVAGIIWTMQAVWLFPETNAHGTMTRITAMKRTAGITGTIQPAQTTRTACPAAASGQHQASEAIQTATTAGTRRHATQALAASGILTGAAGKGAGIIILRANAII